MTWYLSQDVAAITVTKRGWHLFDFFGGPDLTGKACRDCLRGTIKTGDLTELFGSYLFDSTFSQACLIAPIGQQAASGLTDSGGTVHDICKIRQSPPVYLIIKNRPTFQWCWARRLYFSVSSYFEYIDISILQNGMTGGGVWVAMVTSGLWPGGMGCRQVPCR